MAGTPEPDAALLADAGSALLSRGRAEDARPLLERAVALDEDRLGPRRRLAWANLLLGRVDDALAVYETARRRHPDDVLLTLGEGLAKMRAGRTGEGLTQIAHAGWLK